MCVDPVTGLAIAGAVGSAALTGVSAAAQANAQRQEADYQARMDANNAVIAGQQRSAALQQGQQQTMQLEQQQAQFMGSQRANLAANGVDLGSGSAIDQLATTKLLSEQDVNTIQANAARQAWGYAVDRQNSLVQSNLDKWQAQNTNPAAIGAMAGAGSLLGTASLYAASNTKGLNSIWRSGE